MEEIVNRVANSGLITIDLEELYPEGTRFGYDIKQHLWQGIALREKDFREFVRTHDWSQYSNQYVAIYCSEEAIIPSWAFMLLASALKPYARRTVFGNLDLLETVIFREMIDDLDLSSYENGRIIIKGCSKKPVPTDAYIHLVERLQPIAKSIMYGEPCSTVPIYKAKK